MKGWGILGGKIFEEKVKEIIVGKKNLDEVSRIQKHFSPPSLGALILGETKEARKAKSNEIYEAYKNYGYTMREIAGYIGVHYSTISRIIKRFEAMECEREVK